MHAVIRRYRVRLGTTEQAARHAEKSFLPLVREIPGFVASYLVDEGDDVLTTVGLFETDEGAAAAVRVAKEWFRDEWSSFRPIPPEVIEGAVLAAASADRRQVADRRREREAAWHAADRRGGGERRTVRIAPLALVAAG